MVEKRYFILIIGKNAYVGYVYMFGDIWRIGIYNCVKFLFLNIDICLIYIIKYNKIFKPYIFRLVMVEENKTNEKKCYKCEVNISIDDNGTGMCDGCLEYDEHLEEENENYKEDCEQLSQERFKTNFCYLTEEQRNSIEKELEEKSKSEDKSIVPHDNFPMSSGSPHGDIYDLDEVNVIIACDVLQKIIEVDNKDYAVEVFEKLEKMKDMVKEEDFRVFTTSSSLLRAIYLAGKGLNAGLLERLLRVIRVCPSFADFKDEDDVRDELLKFAEAYNNVRKRIGVKEELTPEQEDVMLEAGRERDFEEKEAKADLEAKYHENTEMEE